MGCSYAGSSETRFANSENNFMPVSMCTIHGDTTDRGHSELSHSFSINPRDLRAVVASKLRIVPGIGFPVIISKASTDVGIFFYLSFEHPY
jgi:hypothetical protein